MTKTYIAYYRVSTKEQGQSQLGLKAQKSDVINTIKDGEIIASYTEVESGKNNERPQLLKAIDECKKTGSILVVAKLDRLSRNASFIFTLKDSKVDFISTDMPNANSVTVGVMAVLAQDERERISQRTTAALSEIKRNIRSKGYHTSKKGNIIKSLGSPNNLTDEARKKGASVRRYKAYNNEESIKSGAMIVEFKKSGYTLEAIAIKLNELGFKAPKGGSFSKTQVKRMLERYKDGLPRT